MIDLKAELDLSGRLVARYQLIGEVLYWYGRHIAAQAQGRGIVLNTGEPTDELGLPAIETLYRHAADALEAHRSANPDLEEWDTWRDLELLDWRPGLAAVS